MKGQEGNSIFGNGSDNEGRRGDEWIGCIVGVGFGGTFGWLGFGGSICTNGGGVCDGGEEVDE